MYIDPRLPVQVAAFLLKMGSAEVEQTKVHPIVDCAQPPARTWQRKFEDEGKKIAMFSLTMKDVMTIVSILT